jgi:hypothetical protein
VWDATAEAMHWRHCALNEMGRVLAAGCTPEHLAAVTGFDVEVVNCRHPTDPHAPGQERFRR